MFEVRKLKIFICLNCLFLNIFVCSICLIFRFYKVYFWYLYLASAQEWIRLFSKYTQVLNPILVIHFFERLQVFFCQK